MHFEEELTIRELKHLIDRIQDRLLYANNLDQLPTSSVDERSGARDFKEYLTHKYQIVIRVLQIKFRQRGTSRQHDEIGYFFDGFPSDSDDELRAEIERRRAHIQSEKRLYEDVARAFKIGPDHRLWPSYRLPAISEELSTCPKTVDEKPESTLLSEAVVPGPAQGTDLSNGPKHGDPTGAPHLAKALPFDPAARSKPSGAPLAVTAAVSSHKAPGGRPTSPATRAYNEFKVKYANLSALEICRTFDRRGVPLPGMLSSFGSWIEAYGKNRQSVEAWLREKRRKPRAPRARGKLKRG